METDRPMSEYEWALFSAAAVLGSVLCDLGLKQVLATRLRNARDQAADLGHRNDAATTEMLIRAIDGRWYCQPSFSGPTTGDP
jgi:hypothetical protein